jgi:homoserine kinase
MNTTEEILWNYLSSNNWGLKFRRQHPIAIYVADFYCHKLKLIIEIDGSIHQLEEVKKHDAQREKNLNDLGLDVLRFTNDEVQKKGENVLQKIQEYIDNLSLGLGHQKSPLGVGGITVKSPATVANIVCGFDILGLCIDNPYDEFILSISDKIGVTIENIDEYNLPTDATKNVSGVALLKMLEQENEIKGFHLTSNKIIKPGSGIGSSAASAAGVVVAANNLLGNKFSKRQLVDFAMYGEEVASGAKHADNIAPAIFGGITLIRSNNPLDIISIDYPELFVTILHPQIEVKTADARNILPKEIPLKNAVTQWANVAGLITGFMQHDYDLISRSMEDVVVEPYRSKLIPYFYEVKNACKESGALGGGISGSGPSIFMLSRTVEIAAAVEIAMKYVYSKTGIEFHTHISSINKTGVSVV